MQQYIDNYTGDDLNDLISIIQKDLNVGDFNLEGLKDLISYKIRVRKKFSEKGLILDNFKVCLWPDYDWCYYDDLEELLRIKSDNFIVRLVTINDMDENGELPLDFIKKLVDDN